jgi:hypothetical protein
MVSANGIEGFHASTRVIVVCLSAPGDDHGADVETQVACVTFFFVMIGKQHEGCEILLENILQREPCGVLLVVTVWIS